MATWITADVIFASVLAAISFAVTWRAAHDGLSRMRGAALLCLVLVLAVLLARSIIGGPAAYGDATRGVDQIPQVAGWPERRAAVEQTAKVARMVASASPVASKPQESARARLDVNASRPRAPFDVVRVFYGTDRVSNPTAVAGRIVYGSSRASRLEIGQVDVTVPRTHEVRRIERPWAVRIPFTAVSLLERTEDSDQHFTIRDVQSLSKDAFIDGVRVRLASATLFLDRAVVFVHGYNTDFDFAVYRTAQMAYDLGFDGVPFLYSWPSASGVTSYVYDRDSAEQSEPHLTAFLDLVVRESGAKKLILIAHSMGNRPLMRVFRTLDASLPADVKIDQVILAAPDVDRDLFEQLARGMTRSDRGITLYASRNDRAMVAARLIAGGVPRAGDVPPGGPVVVPGIDTIDISSASTDMFMLNHSLYAQSRVLISDIGMLIATGLRPPNRRLPQLVRVSTSKGVYWRYP